MGEGWITATDEAKFHKFCRPIPSSPLFSSCTSMSAPVNVNIYMSSGSTMKKEKHNCHFVHWAIFQERTSCTLYWLCPFLRHPFIHSELVVNEARPLQEFLTSSSSFGKRSSSTQSFRETPAASSDPELLYSSPTFSAP